VLYFGLMTSVGIFNSRYTHKLLGVDDVKEESFKKVSPETILIQNETKVWNDLEIPYVDEIDNKMNK
jgi:hypothetical protein